MRDQGGNHNFYNVTDITNINTRQKKIEKKKIPTRQKQGFSS